MNPLDQTGFAADQFALASPEIRQDPFPYYEWLREQAPCHKSGGVWLISRYEDVNRLLRDRRLSSDIRKADEPLLTGALAPAKQGGLSALPGGSACSSAVSTAWSAGSWSG